MKGIKKKVSKILLSLTMVFAMALTIMPTDVFAKSEINFSSINDDDILYPGDVIKNDGNKILSIYDADYNFDEYVNPGDTYTLPFVSNFVSYTISQLEVADLAKLSLEGNVQNYNVNVNFGTGTDQYAKGDTVTITANTPETGKQFKEWTIVSGDVTLADSKSATTTFTMPDKDVEVTATYEDISDNTGIYGSDIKVDDILYLGDIIKCKENELGAFNALTYYDEDGKTELKSVYTGNITWPYTVETENHFISWKVVSSDDGYIDVKGYEKGFTPTVNNGTADKSTYYKVGNTVTITANIPATGKQFKEWTVVSGGVTLADSKSATTTFTMPENEVEVTATYEDVVTPPTLDKPVITAGAGSTHQISNGKDMTFTCSGKLEDLTGVYVDGKLVDESNYTLKSGSTILTLKSSYLDTLSAGKHTLKFQYKDNVSAETDFTITAKAGETPVKPNTIVKETASPKTGDTSSTMLYLGLIVLSGCVAGFGLKKKKFLNK